MALPIAYILVALKRLIFIITSSIKDNAVTIGLYLWDFVLVIVNLITPDIAAGKVIPEGDPGYKGIWPKYAAPGAGDSRCPCPALNTLANHGIIPRNGKNIKFADLHIALQKTYHVSAPFSRFLPRGAAQLLTRDLSKDTF